MENKKYQYAVYIGRFQPFHQGHLACVHEGLSLAKNVIILAGSVNQPRSNKNPWSYPQRRRMIRACFTRQQNRNIVIAGVRDYNDDQIWASAVKATVNRVSQSDNDTVALIGHNRDASSYYLSHFPAWDINELPEYQSITATQIRKQLLDIGDIQSVTRPVADQIRHFLKTKTFKALVNNKQTNIGCPNFSDGTLDVN